MISSLPKYVAIDLGSVRERRVDSVIRDEFETGPIQQRRLECRPRYELQVKLQICGSKYNDFLCWFEDVICNGTQYFKMTHPVTGVEKRVRFVTNELDFSFVPYDSWEATVVLERWGK